MRLTNRRLDYGDNVHSKLLRRLDSRYRAISLGALGEQSKQIESDIENFVVEEILGHFSRAGAICSKQEPQFQLKGEFYYVWTGPKIGQPIFQVNIVNARAPKGPTISRDGRVDGIGFYRSIELELASTLSDHAEQIGEFIKFIFVTAYHWMEEFLLKKLTELEEGFTDALYRYLKIVLDKAGKLELAGQIWFSIFSHENGYYALDGKVVLAILEILKRRNFVSVYSPLYHIVMLLGLEMPYDKSFSKHVIETSDYKHFSLNRAAYVSDMPHIFKTEEQMTQGQDYGIFYIGTVGKRQLVASFPSSLEVDLLPILKRRRKELAEIYQSETKLMGEHIAKLRLAFENLDATDGDAEGFIDGLMEFWDPRHELRRERVG